jgi:tRNA threonylcarbamoyladenosine biosynthesis protein TsaB
MDARMDEAYAAAYRHDGRAWQTREAPALYDLATLGARWQAENGPSQVAGSALEAFADRLPWGPARRWPRSADRAGALLRLACAAWAAGRGVPAEEALPVYLRDKVALTTAERAAARAAKPGATP